MGTVVVTEGLGYFPAPCSICGGRTWWRGAGAHFFSIFSHRVRRNGYEVARYAVYKPKGQRAVVCLI